MSLFTSKEKVQMATLDQAPKYLRLTNLWVNKANG